MTSPSDRSGGPPNERMRILQLVENQTLSPDEAARLLESLDRSERTRDRQPAVPAGPRDVRIRITNTKRGHVDLDLLLPLGLVEGGLTVAGRIFPDRLPEIRSILANVTDSFVGTLFDFADNNERIELIVEPRINQASKG